MSYWVFLLTRQLMERLKPVILLCLTFLLVSCNPGRSSGIIPPLTPLHTATSIPTGTATLPPVHLTPTAPVFYPTVNSADLPPVLQQFLAKFDSFEEMNANIQTDYVFIATEVNGRPAGTLDSSPLVALTEGISDCYETAVISALLGEKLGYKPYLLILDPPVFSKWLTHSVDVFQDPITQRWGYNDYVLELHPAEFATLKELADDYILNHPMEGERYDFWYLVDLTKVQEVYGLDWRTTIKNIRIRDALIVESGVYIP